MLRGDLQLSGSSNSLYKKEREEKRKEKIRNEKWGGNAPEQTASFIKEQENI